MLLKIDVIVMALRDLVYERQAEQFLFKLIVKQFLFKVLDWIYMYDLSKNCLHVIAVFLCFF